MTEEEFDRVAVRALRRTTLTEDQLCVLYLRAHFGMDIRSIAEELSITPAAVERLESEARERILTTMNEMVREGTLDFTETRLLIARQ